MNENKITNIKYVTYSIMQVISLIMGITIFSITISNYGFEYNLKIVPENHQLMRAWSLIFFIVFILSSILTNMTSWKNNEKLYYKKFNLYTLGTLCWIFLHKYILEIHNDKGKIINVFYKENKWISNNYFWKCIRLKEKINKVFYNTIIFYFGLLITITGFVLMIIIPFLANEKNVYNPMIGYFTFNTLSYFTQLTNFMCLIFIIYFLFLNKYFSINDNELAINISTYISMVSFVYWISKFDNFFEGDSKLLIWDTYDDVLRNIKTIWLHSVTPSYMVFGIYTAFVINNKKAIIVAFWKKQFLKNTIYPFVYGIYLFTIPFICNYSIYDEYTNANPNLSINVGTVLDPKLEFGSYYAFFSILIIILINLMFISLFWLINKNIHKKNNK